MLGLLDRFRKKKIEEKLGEETSKSISELEQLCGDDKETYEALVNTMFLDPTRIETSLKDAAENAQKSEKAKDFTKARTWYEIAGGLAIYEGNVKKVVEFFSVCEKILPDKKYTILKNPDKAVTKAQEYYKKSPKA
ncbi:MAG: hypothetical protein OEY22_02025 [Candidatus Bathyarchaeota archaeon]|nr:hypothetical protein [Candidatus Bathyarchaeota archaeon]